MKLVKSFILNNEIKPPAQGHILISFLLFNAIRAVDCFSTPSGTSNEIWQCSIDWLVYMNVSRCVSDSYINIWSLFFYNDGVAWGYWCLFAFQIILFANYKICKFYCLNADIFKTKYLFIWNLKWRTMYTEADHFVRHTNQKRYCRNSSSNLCVYIMSRHLKNICCRC